MEAVLTKKSLELRSDGTCFRDYIYIKDVINGYYFLLTHSDHVLGEAFNVSSEYSDTVVGLIKVIQKTLKKKIVYCTKNTAVNEIPIQHLDCTKIRKLGWEPKYSIHRAILETYKWYKNYFRSI